MSTEKIRVCKCKKCQKVLPVGYKHKYCEACNNKRAETTRTILKKIGTGALTFAGVALVAVTGEKINLKK